MNRRNRTSLVLAGGRRPGEPAPPMACISTIAKHPRPGSRSGDQHVVVAAENLPLGTRIDEGARQAGRLAGRDADPGQLCLD